MNAQRIIGTLFIVAALTGTVSCHRVETKKPTTATFDSAIADPVSYVAGNLTFNIRDLERTINRALKPVLVTEETFRGKKGEAWHLRVERTGPVRIRYANRKVSFSAPLRVLYSNPIGLKKHRKQRQLCELAVNFVSPLSIGTNWRLGTHSRFDNYQWIQRPSVRLLGVKIGVTKLAESLLDKRRADIEQAIDNVVHGELRLDRYVRKVWRDMQKPLRISRKPDEFWIIPRPFSIAAAPVYGNSQQITVPLQIAFRVRTWIGPNPVNDTLEQLPRLLRRNHLPAVSRLRVLATIPYADLNRVLDRTLREQKLQLAGGHVKIKKATVYGGGQSLIVKTDVSGAVNGTLYFHGQPQYDTLTNTLRVQQVDFDVDTKERLFATADWLLHDHLRDTLQAVMAVPLHGEISGIPGKIETAFAHAKAAEKTDLSINTFRLVPRRVVIRPDGIQVLISVESKVAVLMKQL